MFKLRFILLFLSLLGLTITVTGCGRESKESASVTITLPEYSSKMDTADYTTMSDENPDDDELPWSSVTPDGLSGQAGVAKPINCYAVMVEGAEQSLRVNTCGRRSSVTGTIDPSQFSFKVGMWVGAYPGTTTGEAKAITMDIPTGLARVFRLIGFHVDNPIDCVLLNDDVPRDKLSRPYVIAESAPIDLLPGEKEIPLTMTFDTQKWFDDCDFGGSSGNSTPVYATKVQIRKDSFPNDKFIYATGNIRCQAIDIQLIDDSYRPAVLPKGLDRVSYILRDGSTNVLTYSNKAECLAAAGESVFEIMANMSQTVRRWVKVPANASGSYSFTLIESNRIPAGNSSQLTPEAAKSFPRYSENNVSYQLIAPQMGYKGEVYPVDVFYRFYNGYHFAPGVNGLTLTETSTFADYYVYDYAAGACLTTDLSGFDMGSVFSKTLCVKHSATEGANVDYSAPFYAHFETRGGSLTPNRLRVLGNNQINVPISGNRCYGPFAITLENEYGVTVNNKAANAINVAFNYRTDSPIAGSSISFHKDATLATALGCGTPWSVGSSTMINTNDYKTYFYLLVPYDATLGYRNVEVIGTMGDGRKIKGTFQFSIDAADLP